MSSDPHTITPGQVSDLLDALGLGRDLKDLRSIHIEGQCVTVVRIRRNEQGHHYPVGGDLATETVTIRVQG